MKKFDILKYISLDENKELIENLYNVMQTYFEDKNKVESYLTNHGILHISNVLENADRLLENKPFSLNENDYLYLILSVIIHDLAMGNYKDGLREGHGPRVRKVVDEIIKTNDALNSNMKEEKRVIICKIAMAHGGGNAQEAYDAVEDDNTFSRTNRNDPHVLFLSMLLRISDELDITQERIKGYSLKAKLPCMDKLSQLHWIKHESIVKWVIFPEDHSRVILLLKNNINDLFLSEYELKFNRNEYMQFMCDSISKLKYEMKIIHDRCSKKGREVNWKLKDVLLKKFESQTDDDSGYIDELNEMLSKVDYGEKFKEGKKSIFTIDESIHQEQKEKEQICSEITANNDGSDKDNKYLLIGEVKYQERLDKYIKKNSMLKQGCYRHKNLRIFTWLDSFSFHQSNFLLHLTSNIIARDIELRNVNQENIDIIIGLGLRGAKIATVVGLKLEKPVYFFVEKDIKIDNLDRNKIYNIVMITDCVITGKTALDCAKELEENKKIHCQNKGVYCVFIRNPIQEKNDFNELMKKDIPIYTINDTYSYTICPFKEPRECPLHICYDDEYYKKTYKQG